MTATPVTQNSDLTRAWGIIREMSNDFRFTPEDVDAGLMRGATEYARQYRGTFEFMVDMHQKALRSWLTVGQAKGVLNCMMAEVRRERQNAASAAAPQETVDFTGLRALFGRAGAHLRSPRITLMVDGVAVTVKLMTRGGHVGSINLQSGTFDNGTWYGRVETNGTLTASRNMTEAVRGLVRELSENPVAAAQRYAHLTGNCCFCNRRLDDERSTQAGYGPVCAGHYGLPWGDREAAPMEPEGHVVSVHTPIPPLSPARNGMGFAIDNPRPATPQVQALPGMTPLGRFMGNVAGLEPTTINYNPETDYRMASDLEILEQTVLCQACGQIVPACEAEWQEVPGHSDREGNVCRRCAGN